MLQLTPHCFAVHSATPFAGGVHTWAHAPQFDASVSSFWHTPLHSVYPASQVSVHAELLQLALAWGAPLHIFAQPPQLLGSFVKLTHAPLQFCVPEGQDELHLLPEHT